VGKVFYIAYCIIVYLEYFPRLIKLIKTKSSNDYSLGMQVLQLVGVISWSVYIFTSRQSVIVYIGTIIDLLLLFMIDFLILKYYNFQKKSQSVN
jgi:uncharacterized protein with PQ loop repeat